MFGWVRSNGLLSKVVEKTRSVTENVITTLDPQMKDFIHSGGDVQVKSTPTHTIYIHCLNKQQRKKVRVSEVKGGRALLPIACTRKPVAISIIIVLLSLFLYCIDEILEKYLFRQIVDKNTQINTNFLSIFAIFDSTKSVKDS